MEKSAGRRSGQQHGNLAAATGLPEDGNIPGISAKILNIIFYPLESGNEVEQTDVAGISVFIAVC